MLMKKVRVTNARNVVLQVPVVISEMHWNVKQGDNLEVSYDERTKELRIKPSKVSARIEADGIGEGLFEPAT